MVLGDGHITVGPRQVWNLHILNDQKYVVANARLLDLMRQVKPGGRPHVRYKPGCVITTMSWRHWLCLFPQHGPGRKHERKIVLWQQEIVDAFPADFLRGLFHSDGCRANNWATRLVGGVKKRYDYPRWQFTNNSGDIRALCCRALDQLHIPWRQSNWKQYLRVDARGRGAARRADRSEGVTQGRAR